MNSFGNVLNWGKYLRMKSPATKTTCEAAMAVTSEAGAVKMTLAPP